MACGLASFVAFLWDGRCADLLSFKDFRSLLYESRYRTIAERFLCMKLAPSRRLVKRDVSYEFMNRQMVWHAFTVSLIVSLKSTLY